MISISNIRSAVICLCLLTASLATARADITVKISVKFILNNDAASTRPGGAIGTGAGFNAEVARGNGVLDATSRGFSISAIEFIDIQPPAPAGAPANVTGGTTKNGPTVTCGNTAGLQNFMRVQGSGIPANTVILSISANTSFTMSNNATATSPAVAIAANFPSDHWFNIPARATRQYIETTALASQATWAWNPGAINVYVNNSSSGQCSFVGSGSSVSFGSTVNAGTVLHEIGHIFNLQHTHALDYSTNTNPPANNPPGVFTTSDLLDGDALTETTNDNPNISTNDQLSVALFGVPYNQPPAPPNAPFATPTQRAVVDSAYENVMSYHNENVLLSVQMDIWTLNANAARFPFCNGRTWFLANDGDNSAAGNTAVVPLATVTSGLSHVSTVNDVVLLRNGSYAAPASGVISTVCTLRATRGAATVHFP